MSNSKKKDRRDPQYAYASLDRVIHERARLSVLTSLAAYPKGLRFGDLKQLCGLTDDNLSRHVLVLQSKFVEISKSSLGQTIGRQMAYLSTME